MKTKTRYWYNDEGQLHRLDGPAMEYADGTKYWYQNGYAMTEAAFLKSI